MWVPVTVFSYYNLIHLGQFHLAMKYRPNKRKQVTLVICFEETTLQMCLDRRIHMQISKEGVGQMPW